METGKTGKYFKYAIGEIVLVVIGILIALSINNWNQKRLELDEENIILTNLRHGKFKPANHQIWRLFGFRIRNYI